MSDLEAHMFSRPEPTRLSFVLSATFKISARYFTNTVTDFFFRKYALGWRHMSITPLISPATGVFVQSLVHAKSDVTIRILHYWKSDVFSQKGRVLMCWRHDIDLLKMAVF